MRHPLLLTLGVTGRLLEVLGQLARERGVVHHALRRPKGCLRLLRGGGCGVVLVRLGQDLEQETTLLAELAASFPETAAVVLDDSGNPALAGLAWDLGAACVVAPPLGPDQVPAIVARLLDTVPG